MPSRIEATNTYGYSSVQSTTSSIHLSAGRNEVLNRAEEHKDNSEHVRVSIYSRNNVPKAIKATPIFKFTTEMLLTVGTMHQLFLYKRVWMRLVLISMAPS